MKNIKLTVLSSIISILFSISIYAQSIKGTVKDKSGEGLAGANITILNTNYGASADLDGYFELKNIPIGKHTLKISYVGFKPVTKSVVVSNNKATVINFVLQDSENVLDEVLIKGQSLKLRNSVTSIDVIGVNDMKDLMMTIEQPLRIIEQVPGVNINAYGQGGVADKFTIRGFGGGHGGGAAVEVDGISLNEAEAHSDGYADLNILIPLSISNAKVYKGPSSVLFGKFAKGGTLAIETRKGGEYQDFSLRGGSYATIDAQYAQGSAIKLGNSDKELKTNFAGQVFKTDGYVAKHSEVLKGNIDGRIAYDFSDKTEVSLSVRAHKSNWNAPGYIPKEQYDNDKLRNKIHPTAENDGGQKTFFSQRLNVNYKISDNIKLLIFGYGVQQDFTRIAKYNFNPDMKGQTENFNERNTYAIGGSLNSNSKIGNMDLDWIAGIEYYTEKTDRHKWMTSFRRRIGKSEEQYYDIQSISAFVQGELDLHKLFRPSIGVRYDTYTGDYTINKIKTPKNEVATGKVNNLYHISPKLGFRSTLTDGLDFRASASNGFSLPNRAEKYNASNGLDPAELWQYEVGLSYNNQWLDIDVAGFILNASKEVINVTTPSGIERVNAGRTERSGIEAKLNVEITEGLELLGTYSTIKTKIAKSDKHEGKILHRIPSSVSSVGLSYTSPIGLGGNINFRDIGDYYIDRQNKIKYDGYSITNLTLFYNFNKMFSDKGRLFLTVNNLFSEKYAGIIWAGSSSINYGSSPTRNFSLGVNYSF